MRVMVTGVAGFIGSNLAAELLRRGYDVSGLDNLSQGTLFNLAAFESHDRVRSRRGRHSRRATDAQPPKDVT